MTRVFEYFICLTIVCSSCKSNEAELSSNSSDSTEESVVEPENGRYFFEFDALDHYSIEFDFDGELDLDGVKKDIMRSGVPKSVSDTLFIDKLQEIGFIKTSINKVKFQMINDIFREKDFKKSTESMCYPTYRDILIFKRNNLIIGIAKICFECDKHVIKGTYTNTEDFGQNGDYDILESILKYKIEK